LKKATYYLVYVLGLIPSCGIAGELGNILFDGQYTITINHQNCKLEQPIEESKKLILPLAKCASGTAGEIEIFDNNLEKIHWAQHTPEVVWVVITFLEEYHFTTETSPDQYKVCLPICDEVPTKTLLNVSPQTLFSLQGIPFQIPLQGMSINEFIDRSIGYVSKDVVRDGLPNFGSKRDDWLGKLRKHEGYDIYITQANVIAAAAGVVKTIGKGYRSGLYIKLDHGNELYTVYVHLKEARVKEGQKVKSGEVIGIIDGPAGNAVEAQLHFEIKISDKSVDPLPFIEHFYRGDHDITQKIQDYKQSLTKRAREREEKVKAILKPY